MFKKVSIGIVCLVLMATFACFAAPRNAGVEELAVSTQTTFTNIGVVGEDVTGNPGFIAMTNTNGDVYYLFVDWVGNLRLTSYTSVSAETSFPSGNWGTSSTAARNMGGTAVGDQAY